MRKKAEEKKLDLICNIDQDVHDYVIGDKVRLNQIIMNILGNAIKFTKNGSVTLTVKKLKSENGEMEL